MESVQQASVQVFNSSALRYVGIGRGDVSNVNTKPEDEQSVFPERRFKGRRNVRERWLTVDSSGQTAVSAPDADAARSRRP